MIVNFKGKIAEEIWEGRRSKQFPPEETLIGNALFLLEQLDSALDIEDLKHPPSNRLHPLRHERKGQHSISINKKWRICFTFSEGNAHDVEILDYH